MVIYSWCWHIREMNIEVAAIPISFILPLDSQVFANANLFENIELVHAAIREFHIQSAPGFRTMTWKISGYLLMMGFGTSTKSFSLVREAIAEPFAVISCMWS
jgi:hypothetical protein